MNKKAIRAGLMISSSLWAGNAEIAWSQDLPPAAESLGVVEPALADEIIVTARKRDETSISVPVAVTAVTGSELTRRGVVDMDGLARLVPALNIGEGGGTVQGGIVAIRGLSGADNNPLNDQAVSFNIDGVSVGRSSVRRLSDLDLQQIEVLKGPQALFFGKNSPAGIISVRTANPGNVFEGKIAGGYEFGAREWRTDGFVSGPLTDKFGGRIAASYSTMEGWAKNVRPGVTGIDLFPLRYPRAPNRSEFAVRGTLKFDDGDRFDALLKVTYGQVKGAAASANVQNVFCPMGFPQTGANPANNPRGLPVDSCRPDDEVFNGEVGPNFANLDPAFGDGNTSMTQSQWLGSFAMNYHITSDLTLTSVTGLYRSDYRNLGNFTSVFQETGVPPRQILASVNELDLREISQELRLTSDFSGPGNFILGTYYQDTYGRTAITNARNALNPTFVGKYLYIQDGKAYSVFGQVMIDLLPTVEFSMGARYSYESKVLPVLSSTAIARNGALAGDASVLVPITNPNLDRSISFNNLSPEFTLAWRPSPNLTLYGSYKEGFLSGGFAALTVTPGIIYGGIPGTPTVAPQRINYDEQLTRGFEAGIKARLFDGTLRTDLVVYDYKTSGLQVGVTVQGINNELRNAGEVRTRGAEFTATYETPVSGLSLDGAVAYNQGRYTDYQASCYRGQPSSTCFFQVSRSTGEFALLQDLSGKPLVRAPDWTGNAGFVYNTLIAGNFRLSFSGNVSLSSSYYTDTINAPGGRQGAYELYDAGLTFGDVDGKWDVALIGRNLSDSYYFLRSNDTPFTGTNPGCSPAVTGAPANCTGAHVTSPLLGDTSASVSRGREVFLRFTYHFGG